MLPTACGTRPPPGSARRWAAQCHDHKYDPFTQKDFYSFAAFFADVKEEAIKRQVQTPMLTAQQQPRLTQLDGEIAAAKKERAAWEAKLAASQPLWEAWIAAATVKPAALPADVTAALAIKRSSRTAKQKLAIKRYYRGLFTAKSPADDKLQQLQRQRAEVVAGAPTTLITEAVPPRTVRLLPRGNWQDDSGPVMSPAVPEFLGKVETGTSLIRRNGPKGAAHESEMSPFPRATRLDLARWMVARENPLVARVMVNRLWRLLFGEGLVRTMGDLGTQGSPPTHPELLDWLAVELEDSGWDVKHVIKLMVMSRTYQQASRSDAEMDRLDPANLWLARQGRFRLDAEFVRDNALAISGLLSLRQGGPPVKPYQPAGYWSFLNFPQREWQNDHGENQYRRGLYTFWQRTFLHPSLLAFDACTREESTPERARSNTPLQALAMLNDPTYVEAAKMFAARIVREGGSSEHDRLRYAYHRALQRDPTQAEAALLTDLYRRHLVQYKADAKAAAALLTVGDAKPPADMNPVELAAWTSVTRVILNLHETISRD